MSSILNQVGSSRATLGALRRTLVKVQRLRESADEIAVAATDCSTLIDRIKLLQDEVFALVGEQTNRTLFTPTIVTVLALPMTIVSSFFGMNVPAYRFNTVAGSGSW